jgi:hypothetical protein
MTVQIENTVEGALGDTDDYTFGKFTTKTVCKTLGCKGSSLRNAMKYIDLKIGKDEFGNRWFTREDIDNIKEGMKSKKTDMLLKLLYKELEKETGCELFREQSLHTFKTQTQTCVGQLGELLKLEINNSQIAQTELLLEEMRALSFQNLAHRSRKEDQLKKDFENLLSRQAELINAEFNEVNGKTLEQFKLEIENVIKVQNEVVRDGFSLIHKSNDELRKFIEEQVKQEIKINFNNQLESIRDEINAIRVQEEEAKKTIVEQFKIEIQSIFSTQTETVKNEIVRLYKHNEDLKKRVEELTRMIQTTQEGHFKAVDERLHQLVESSKKRSLFKSK